MAWGVEGEIERLTLKADGLDGLELVLRSHDCCGRVCLIGRKKGRQRGRREKEDGGEEKTRKVRDLDSGTHTL